MVAVVGETMVTAGIMVEGVITVVAETTGVVAAAAAVVVAAVGDMVVTAATAVVGVDDAARAGTGEMKVAVPAEAGQIMTMVIEKQGEFTFLVTR